MFYNALYVPYHNIPGISSYKIKVNCLLGCYGYVTVCHWNLLPASC